MMKDFRRVIYDDLVYLVQNIPADEIITHILIMGILHEGMLEDVQIVQTSRRQKARKLLILLANLGSTQIS